MTEARLYPLALWSWIAVAVVLFPIQFFITAPYGRHSRPIGPQIRSTLGWVLMEIPGPVIMLALFLIGDHRSDPASWAFLLLYEIHYVNRALIFPFRRRGGERPMPLLIVASAFSFNCLNGYFIGRGLFQFAPARGAEWLFDPRFLVGATLFFAGLFANLQADSILRNLRAPGETGYRIPRGGLYTWITCPNYFSEMIEWSGYALSTFALPSLAFLIWTVSNLLPRALSHHRWYRERFADYPAERRAVIPLLL
jgi:hypothetical protein